MIQKPPALSIDPADPFVADCFGLKDFSEALTQVVCHTPESFVINLEAPWGQGKTTFLEMWRHHLRSQGVDSLYFNAWESDFSREPLIALIGELSAGMASMEIDATSPAWGQLAKLKKVGARVAVRALPALVKAGTLGVLDLSEVVEDAIASASEKVAEGEIQRYQEAKSSILEFRKELARFSSQLSSESKYPLVIVIDELDRCRPDYAISVLETVKHLFTVPGVVFVVATDSRQLSNAIKHIYGLDAAAEDYLRRFFDLSVSLPAPSTRQFVEALIVRHGLGDFFKQRTHPELQYDHSQLVAALEAMFEATECSLRDQQKCFILLTISMRSVEADHYLHPLLLCTLIVLRVKRPALFYDFVSGRTGAGELVGALASSARGREFFSSSRGHGSSTYAYLLAATSGETKREEEISKLKDRAGNENGGDDAELARQILGIYQHYSFRNARSAIRRILPRIEFFARSSKHDNYD